MALVLTEEQTMLRDRRAAFLAEQSAGVASARLRDEQSTPTACRARCGRRFAEMGFAGRAGAGSVRRLRASAMVEAGVVMEEIGRDLAPSPLAGDRGASPRPALTHGGSRRPAAGLSAGDRRGLAAGDAGDRRGAKHRPLQPRCRQRAPATAG
ncbi:MAG: acyl-CoA dehydrogenase family protein [Rhodopseudomonas palustris]|nr:acyl-CoA dehydrogenase family protein [Rhodopseudomonas palustris]